MVLSDPQLRSISIGIPIGKLRRPQFLGRKAAQFFGPNSGPKNGAASGSDGFDSRLWLDLDAAQILRPRNARFRCRLLGGLGSMDGKRP